MLRAVLLGVLSVSTVATGCGSKSDAPKVEPGAPAGKVLEVSGKVTVGTKALAVGDTVKSDDTIETGPDGSVVIELAHNQARWELGPGRKVKPTESAAWTAQRASGPAKQVEQTTTAAGRPAERSAADTSVSGGDKGAAEPAAAVRSPGPTAAPTTGSPAPGGGGRAEPPPPPPPPPTAAPEQKPLERGDRSAPPAPPKASKPETKEAKAASPLDVLHTCVPEGTTISIKVHVAKHVPTIEFVGAVDAKIKRCMITAAKKLKLPIESGDMSLEVTR